MKNVTLCLLMVSLFIHSGFLFAQEKNLNQRNSNPSPAGIYRCLSDEYNAELLKKHPDMMGSPAFEKKIKQVIDNRKTARILSANGATLVRIPVVGLQSGSSRAK